MTLLQRLLTKTRSVETIESERRSQNSKVEKDKPKEKNKDVEKLTEENSQQEDSTKQI